MILNIMKKTVLAIFSVVLIVIMLPTIYVFADGECGVNLSYSFDETSGILTISGLGKMNNYPWGRGVPWDLHKEHIKSVIIDEGVTSIGEGAFSDCKNLSSVTIPNSVLYIGELAFDCCYSLNSVIIPGSIDSVGTWAFHNCINLVSVKYLGATEPNLGRDIFYGSNCSEANVPNNYSGNTFCTLPVIRNLA